MFSARFSSVVFLFFDSSLYLPTAIIFKMFALIQARLSVLIVLEKRVLKIDNISFRCDGLLWFCVNTSSHKMIEKCHKINKSMQMYIYEVKPVFHKSFDHSQMIEASPMNSYL